MRINIYSIWMDPAFYMAAAVFALALFLLLFSIRKYLEIKNADFEDEDDGTEEVQDELPLTEAETGPAQVLASSAAEDPEPEPVPEALPSADETPVFSSPELSASGAPSRAEEFVKGLYDRLASLDDRVKNIEGDLSKSKVSRDFTAKFLEDMVADFDSLDKTKIKSRIEYLLADLKK